MTRDQYINQVAIAVSQSRAGGRVERCHGIPHQQGYTNAAHSWGVAMLMHYLFPADFERLALICLAHDVPEAWVGDIPAPTMRYVPGLRDALGEFEGRINKSLGLPAEGELTPEDHAKLKACDRLDFYLWCREQLAYGNSYAEEACIEIERYMSENPMPEPAQTFYKRVQGMDIRPRQQGVMRDICATPAGQGIKL